MKYVIRGKKMDVSDSLMASIERKLGKLDKYFAPDTEAIVTLGVEKGRQRVEITIPVKGTIIRSEQESDDMYVSIDLAAEIIERQLLKYRKKLIDKHQEGGGLREEFANQDDDAQDGEIRITRNKRIGLKPMFPEDACVQMELLGHNFFVFINAETEEVNVVYRRKDQTFGLIEPERE